jgi:hypothetical protein
LAHEVIDSSLIPDVVLIVEDLRGNKFYFIQVKYLRVGGKSYISGDLDHIVSGKLSKGVKKLVDTTECHVLLTLIIIHTTFTNSFLPYPCRKTVEEP